MKKFGYDVHTLVRVRPSTLIAIGFFARALIFLKYIFQADVRKSVLPSVAVKSLRLRRMKLKQQIEIRKVEKNERKYKRSRDLLKLQWTTSVKWQTAKLLWASLSLPQMVLL